MVTASQQEGREFSSATCPGPFCVEIVSFLRVLPSFLSQSKHMQVVGLG